MRTRFFVNFFRTGDARILSHEDRRHPDAPPAQRTDLPGGVLRGAVPVIAAEGMLPVRWDVMAVVGAGVSRSSPHAVSSAAPDRGVRVGPTLY